MPIAEEKICKEKGKWEENRGYYGDASGVIIIVMGTVQILYETDCISHSTNAQGTDMNAIILSPAVGK